MVEVIGRRFFLSPDLDFNIMKRLLPMLIVAVLTAQALAQGDVPPIAQHEIARRGSHVEHTGTIRSGLMAEALSPPADDSAKWFVTLIVKPGDPASEKMRAMVATDPAIRPWIDVREPAKSTTHFHIRSIDDPTQADWLRGLRPAIERSGLPLVVLQPPKNGQFGPGSTIVKLIGGVVTGDELGAKLRDGIIAYIQALEPRGISQTEVGVAPPFNVAPKDPAPPMVPFVFPEPTPQEPPPNPSTPAPAFPTQSLALTIGMFIAGWITARLKTFVGTKLSGFGTVLARLNELQNRDLQNQSGQNG